MTITYIKGLSPAGADVSWDDDGEPLDLTGAALSIDVFKFRGSTIFTKTDGLTGQNPFPEGDGDADDEVGFAGTADVDAPRASLVVEWPEGASLDALEALEAGRYVMHFVAVVDGVTYDLYDELVVSEPAANRGYCDATDLKTGDLTKAPNFDPYFEINSAADEINARIGQRYTLPLDMRAAPEFVSAMMRSTNAKLATGRYLCERANNNDKNVHAYGKQLIAEAMSNVEAITCGAINLLGVPKLTGSTKSIAPGIRNHDQHSLVDGFENFAHRGDFAETVRPGLHGHDPVVGEDYF